MHNSCISRACVRQDHHGLRGSGSASPVLTAIGLISGQGQILTPCRIDTPQLIEKVEDLCSCAKFSTNPSTYEGRVCKWAKYNDFFIYL